MVFVVAEREAEVAATSVVKQIPAVFWPDRDRPAACLSKRTSKRSVAGHRLGAAMPAWSERHSASLGKEFVRLDCWAENRRLCAFYACAVCTEVGDAEGYGEYKLKLFEKAIGPWSGLAKSKGSGVFDA
jgi:hypothetical protein